jgi:acyl carrier protein
MLHTVVESNIAQLFAGSKDKTSHSFKVGCDKTMRSAKEAVVLSQQLKSKDLEAVSQYWLGQVYLAADRYDQGLQAAQESASLFELFEEALGQAFALVIVGQAHFALQAPDRGKEALNEALKLTQEAGDKDAENEVNKLIEKLTGVSRRGSDYPHAGVGQGDFAMAMAEMPAGGMPSAAQAVEVEYVPPDPKMMMQRIGDMVSNMTGEESMIEADTPFMDVGMDSLASVEFRVALQKEFGVTLPTTVMFNYPTPGGLTNYLVDACTEKAIPWGR